VALFSLSLIAPAVFASSAESKLPACCLRAGKHHCGMAGGVQTRSGPAAGASKCIFFPSTTSVPASQMAGLPGISRVMAAGIFSRAASLSRTESRSRISYSQAGQKRGPPSLFS
jgi:hypothetical protein